MSKFAWSDTEDGPFETAGETRDEAIAAAINDAEPGDERYIGEAEPISADSLIDDLGTLAVDTIGSRLFDEVGEIAEGWRPTKEQEEDLNEKMAACVKEWMTRHGLTPTVYAVSGVERIEVTQELIDQHYVKAAAPDPRK